MAIYSGLVQHAQKMLGQKEVSKKQCNSPRCDTPSYTFFTKSPHHASNLKREAN